MPDTGIHMIFYQLAKWSWPKYTHLNSGWDHIYSSRQAAEGALLGLRNRGEDGWFIAELHVSEENLSKEFVAATLEATQ